MSIPLSAAVTALDIAVEYAAFYYDLQDKDILALEDPFESDYAAAEFEQAVQSDPERYVLLPGHAELENADIQGCFARTQPQERQADLLSAARGLYAATEFPLAVSRLGLTEEWKKFRDKALEDAAREWAELNGVDLF